MNTKDKMQNKKVTICACTSRSFIEKDKVAEIAAVMIDKGYNVTVEADLCRKVIQDPSAMQGIAAGAILACYPRAIRSHLDWLGLKAGTIIDIRNNSSEKALSQFDISYPETDCMPGKEIVVKEIEGFPVENGTDAWYPVLDKTKCTECGKCHDFCLFGVYSIENKQVRVVQPQNCKNNCPACARMCPSKAIIFPKYEKSPINGGMIEEEKFNPEKMDKIYKERLRAHLQQRRSGISLLKEKNK